MSFKETEVGIIPYEWNVDIIDNIKSDKKNAIAMGPFGSNIKKENFVEDGIPVIRGNNLNNIKLQEKDFVFLTEEKAEKLKASEVNRGDIIITHRGTLGQVSIVPQNSKYDKYIVSQSGMKLTCDNKKVNPLFINYFLNSRMGQYLLLRNKSQVGVPSIASPTTSLKKIPVPLPKIEEQNFIVKILDDLDEKIETNNQINKKLEEMAQAIFKQWFVDFEFPNEDGEPYKSSGGVMVESEMGMIPKEWEVKNLNDTIEIKYGKNLPTKKLIDKGYPVFGGNGVIGFYSEYLYKEPQVLVACRGAASGKVLTSLPYSFITNNSLILENSYKYLTYEYLKQYCLENQFFRYATGSAQPQITIANLATSKILIPSKMILEDYSRIIQPIESKKLMLSVENEKIISVRDLLLSKLMSGEIRVPIDSNKN